LLFVVAAVDVPCLSFRPIECFWILKMPKHLVKVLVFRIDTDFK